MSFKDFERQLLEHQARYNSLSDSLRQEYEDRKRGVIPFPTWLEARKQRLLFNSNCNKCPDNNMFQENGWVYLTKIYLSDRIKASCMDVPVRYDIEYIIDFYQQRIIKELSLENQLILLKAITSLYSDDSVDVNDKPSIESQFEQLQKDSQLELLNKLAKSVGKRVIKK